MPIPQKTINYYEKDSLENAIDNFTSIKEPSKPDLNQVKVAAQIQAGINAYRANARNMSVEELENEPHNSKRLGNFMEVQGDPRPHHLCDAHAIISGGHTYAGELRAILAWFQRRIDDPINGCWLPRNSSCVIHMPKRLENAVPHSRIHRKRYYEWLNNIIALHLVQDDIALMEALKMIAFKLQTSTFPQAVMLPAGKET